MSKLYDVSLNFLKAKSYLEINEKKLTYKKFSENLKEETLKLKKKGIFNKKIIINTNLKDKFWIYLLVLLKNKCDILIIDNSYNTKELKDIKLLFKGHYNIDANGLKIIDENNLKKIKNRIFIPSSGTTGKIKLITLSEEAILINSILTSNKINLKSEDIIFFCTSYRFITSISHFFTALFSGAKIVCNDETKDIKKIINIIKKKKITFFGGAPIHVSMFIQSKVKFDNLKHIMITGDHLSEDKIKKFFLLNESVNLIIGYGLTEIGGRLCLLNYNDETKKNSKIKGSVGKPLPIYDLKILNEKKIEQKINTIGKIYICSHYLFDGYLSKENVEKKIKDNLFDTGDVGYKDKDGYIFLLGRSDSVYKKSGIKISLQKINNEIQKQEGVKDSHVYVKKDNDFGVEVKCILQLDTNNNNNNKSNQIIKNIKIYLNNTLKRIEIPDTFIVVKKIPRTNSGKVLRSKLV